MINKKIKIIAITLLFTMGDALLAQGVIAHAANPTIECIDTPTVNYSTAISQAKLNVAGWALSDAGVKQVEILVDNKVVGNATIGEARPDVAHVYTSYSNATNSGYSYSLDVSALSSGNHQLTVETIDNSGNTVYLNRNFSTYSEVPMGVIDTVPNGATYYNSPISVQGWAVNPSGMKSVNVYVDGNLKGQAQLGIARPDVQNVYQGYAGADTSGYSYSLDTNGLKSGSHTITLVCTGNDGSNITLTRQINIAGLIDCIDFPQSNVVYGQSLNVSGWAMDSSAITSVNVSIDGGAATAATINQPRPDVAKVFPNYSNSGTSGYSTTLNIGALSNAKHTLTITYTAANGDTDTKSVQFQKGLPAMSCIDTPRGIINGNSPTIPVVGWALNSSGVKQINVLVDNNQVGTATIGDSRPDVQRVFPNYNDSNSGYHYNLSTSLIGGGTHTITIQAIGNDGTTNTQSTTVTRPDNIMCVDYPSNNQNAGNSVTVAGWALNVAGIKEVDVLVDNQKVGTATIGIARPDVARVFSVYNNSSSGYNYTVDTSNLSGGTHTITVNAIGNDGSVTSQSRTINRPSNIMCIDYPSNNQNVGNSVTVAGWALNVTGTKEVDVLVDGNKVGTATIGIARPDVANVFPAYNNSSSGYNYNLDLSSLSGGAHTITVNAIGNDGTVTSQSRTINRPADMMNIDTPTDLQNVNGTISVAGWALDVKGMKEVDVLVDGQNVGQATLGIARPDVQNVFPAYNISNSGFNYSLNVSGLSAGAHRLTVTAVGNSGLSVSQSLLIVVGNLSIYQGADVYEGDNISNYQQFKASGVQVVIQKATQGETYVDSLLNYRATNLASNGFLVGFYHYADNDNNPDGQAQHFLNAISGLHSDTVLWLDIENEGDWNKQQAASFTREFINYVQARGYKIGIYSGLNFYNDYLADSNFNVPTWIASYGAQPPQYPSVSWQYTDTGSVSGVTGNIDLDKFNSLIFN